jgi:Zn-finger nucleic acid-binding protein
LTDITIGAILLGMGRVKVDAFRCDRCGHVWLPKELLEKLDELDKHLPKVCPKCKNPYWNTPRKVAKEKTTEKNSRKPN